MWETKRLSKIGDIVTGNTPSTKDSTNYGSDIPFVKPPELRSNLVLNSPEMLSKKGAKSARVLPPNSVMVSCIGNLGKVAINKVPVATNQQINSIIPNEDIDSKFLFYQVQSQNFRNQLSALSSATTVSIVNKGNFSKVEIPVPPLPTQNRIVEKIEELFSELDNGVENLKKAQQQLKTYRQAVLKDAFEGKLTAAWRKQQDDLPTPEELLRQIKAERKAHRQRELAEWEKEVEQWEKDGKPGRKQRKPRKVNEVEPISEKKLNKLAELPNNWLWLKLGRVIDQPKYGTSEKCDYDFDGFGVLRIPNIGKGIVDSEDMKYAPLEEDEASKYALQVGDILTIRSNGSIDLVGKCALIREPDTNFLHAGYLIRLRPYKGVADSRYLLNVLSSVSLRSQIESKAKSTSGVNNINSGELQDLIIPLCSIKEQKEIVKEIESRLSVVDQLEQTIQENLQKAEALRQSILKKAFGGELVL